jgi:type III secretory pathway lipoprotein EscJ
VILKHRPDFDFEMVESELKSVVANSVVGLTADDVEVLGIPAEFIMPQLRPAPVGGVSAGLSSIPPLLLAGVSSAAGAMLAGLIVWLVRRRPAAVIKA